MKRHGLPTWSLKLEYRAQFNSRLSGEDSPTNGNLVEMFYDRRLIEIEQKVLSLLRIEPLRDDNSQLALALML
jgi:hypothetical protein